MGKRPWYTVTTIVVGLLLATWEPLHGQATDRAEVQLRVGWWAPLSTLSMVNEDYDGEPSEGTLALSASPSLGVGVTVPLSPRSSVRSTVSVTAPRPIPRFEGSLCEVEYSAGRVDDDCRWRGAPRGWVVQGAAEAVLSLSDGFRVGFGVAPRYFRAPNFDCLAWAPGGPCVAAGNVRRHSTFTAGAHASIGARFTLAHRPFTLDLANTVIRVEGKAQHEMGVTLGVPVVSW